MQLEQIKIIQGGMGIHISSWKLAKTVSQKGQLGVVSGTAIDTVVARMLHLGDKDGAVRNALEHFPITQMAQRVKDRFFNKDPKSAQPFKGIGMPAVNMTRAKNELLIVANFVEVFLAKEGHDGLVGINYLEKIQIPTLPSLFGAMLAGVNVVLMGAGIPSAIPGILDNLADFNPVSLKLHVDNDNTGEDTFTHFDPNEYFEKGDHPSIARPAFLAIVSSDIVARQLDRKATGYVDGYVVENYRAGGHNAPPRRDRNLEDNGMTTFNQKDEPNLEKIRNLGKPFWLAGKFSTPEAYKSALAEGATGFKSELHSHSVRNPACAKTFVTGCSRKALKAQFPSKLLSKRLRLAIHLNSFISKEVHLPSKNLKPVSEFATWDTFVRFIAPTRVDSSGAALQSPLTPMWKNKGT